MRKILILLPFILLIGCSNPQKALYRESADADLAPVLNDWGNKNLTDAQIQNGQKNIQEYYKLRDQDRLNDKGITRP